MIFYRRKPKSKNETFSFPEPSLNNHPNEPGYAKVDVCQTDNAQSLLMMQPQRIAPPPRRTGVITTRRPDIYSQLNKLREPTSSGYQPAQSSRGRVPAPVHMVENDLYIGGPTSAGEY